MTFLEKKRSSKTRKIDISPKGLTHGFGPNMAIFLTFFFGNKGQEIVFYDILETKNAFLGYKNNKFKKVEKLTFLHGFGPKMAIFASFFFRQYRPGKRLL